MSSSAIFIKSAKTIPIFPNDGKNYASTIDWGLTVTQLDTDWTFNRRQNELRHFTQNWAFLRFINFKRRKYSFPPPSPPCNVVPLF